MTADPGPILVGFDGTKEAFDAIALARLLRDATGARLVLARVFPRAPWHTDEKRGEEEALLIELEEAAAAEGATAEPVAARSAARGLHELAESLHAAAVVLGSSHRGIAGMVLAGPTAERLLHGAPCAVAVAPRGTAADEDPALRVIAVGYDGSPEADIALHQAIDLAVRARATMRIFTVVPEAGAVGAKYYSERLDEAQRAAPAEVRAAVELLHDDPVSALLSEGEKGVDLMVLGSRGFGPLGSVLLGGVSTALVRAAPCPLLLTPRGETQPDA